MRVAVVGAGVMGAASAWALARRGHDVTVLERFAPANPYGSSHGHARIFRVAYDVPDYVDLARRALAGWREIEVQSGTTLLATTGSVDHGDPGALAAIRAAMAEAGGASAMLSARGAAERWPGLRFEGDVHLDALGGRLDAEAAVGAMLGLASARGATVRHQRASAIESGPDRATVTTDAGRHAADVVVVAAGAWSTALHPGAGLPAIEVTVEQPAHFAPFGDAPWPSFIHHRPEGAGPPIYGLLEPGAGVKLGEHGSGRAIDPDDLDRAPEPAGIARLRAYAERWLPGVDPSTIRAQGCLYASTPDHAPVVDRVGHVVFATGFSGHGFKFAPEIGALVTTLVEGGDAHPRFALPTAT